MNLAVAGIHCQLIAGIAQSVQWLGYTLPFDFLYEYRIPLGSTQPPVLWVPGALPLAVKAARSMNLSTHLPQVPRLRICAAISLFPATSFDFYSVGCRFESPPWHYPVWGFQSLSSVTPDRHQDSIILSRSSVVIKCRRCAVQLLRASYPQTHPPGSTTTIPNLIEMHRVADGTSGLSDMAPKGTGNVRECHVTAAPSSRRGACVAYVQVSLTPLRVIVPPTCGFCPHRTWP